MTMGNGRMMHVRCRPSKRLIFYFFTMAARGQSDDSIDKKDVL
jgi:hypothetical protein